MKTVILLMVSTISFLHFDVLAQAKLYDRTENVLVYEFSSKVFNNARGVRILLPPGYDDEENRHKKYAVLYMNDGFALFKYWNVEETVENLIKEGKIEPIIVVGIDNAITNDNNFDDRTREYLPYPDESEPTVPNPQGKNYPDFLLKEIMPFVKKTFRVKNGAAHTALGGSSYGAYIALYTAITKPGKFGKLLLESTPLFIHDFQIYKDVQQAKRLPNLIYIGVGTNETADEHLNAQVKDNVQELESLIRVSNPNAKVHTIIQKGAAHNSGAWRERLPVALQLLFGIRD